MKTRNTSLGTIMSLLGISGQELANHINVDRTLVSKWKNNVRPFSNTSIYFNGIVEYILKKNQELQANTLERFFESIYPIKDMHKDNWLSVSLRSWLDGNDFVDFHQQIPKKHSQSLYTTNVDIYRGNSGRRKAVLEFLKYALSLPKGQQLLISDMEDMSWLLENKNFINTWQDNIKKLINKGDHITIIHNTKRDVYALSNIIFRWLPIYFTGSLVSYYYQDNRTNIPSPTVYIIKDHMAIMGMGAKKDKQDKYTAIYKDSLSISQMEWVFKQRLSVSTPLVDLYEFSHDSIEKLTGQIINLGKKKEQAYLLTPIPVFTTMPQETLIEVLKENNISGKLMEQCLFVHKEIQAFYLKDITKYFCRQFYDLDILNKISDMKEITYLELSEFALKPVIVSNKHFKSHIKAIIDYTKTHELSEVALLPFNKLNVPLKVSIWVKQNCFVYSYPQFDGKRLTLSSDSMTINSFYQKLEEIWESVPIINKDKHWVLQQLEKMIK